MTEVRGHGPRTARILVVGEAPAANEVREGKPFVGKAGQELDRLLRDAGLRREEIYVTNASLEQVTGDKDKFFFEPNGNPSQVFLRGLAALISDVNEIKPNVVIAMGNYAHWACTQKMDITRWRGSLVWSDLLKVKVVPTLHPAALLRGMVGDDLGAGQYKYRPVVIWDLEKAKEQSASPEFKPKERTLVIDPQHQDLELAVERLRAAKQLTFDIETFGGTNLACIGFSDGDPTWAVTIPYNGMTARLDLFRTLLETDVPKIGQNLMYDVSVLDQLGIRTRGVTYDTMIAQGVLLPDLPKGLDFLTSIYTDMPYYKDEGKIWKRPLGNLEQFWKYNAKDVCATTESWLEQRKILDEDEDLRITFRRRMRVFEPLRMATYEGFPVNVPLMKEKIKDVTGKANLYQAKLNEIAGYEVNVNSPVQIKRLIYEEIGLPVRTRDGKATTRSDVLMDMAAKEGNPALTLIVLIRHYRKLLSNYYHDEIVDVTGRARFSFNIVGTKTGRLSSSKPLWGPGLNGQNIPDEARDMFVAEDGWEIGAYDQTQAETIVTAYLANDPVHIDCFRTGKDVHAVTACLMYQLPPDQWTTITKSDPRRQIAKTCNHGLNYGMGPLVLMMTVNEEWDPEDPNSITLDKQQAEDTYQRYHASRPALRGYWEWVRSQLSATRTLVTPLRNKRIFLDPWGDQLLKDGYSWIPQGTVGEGTNIGIIRVMQDPVIQELGVKFRLQVHDEAVFTWRKEHRAIVDPIIKRKMEVPLHIGDYFLTIPIEGFVGPNWKKSEMEKLGVSRKTVELTIPEYEEMFEDAKWAMGFVE